MSDVSWSQAVPLKKNGTFLYRCWMLIGHRLKEIRESKNLSQGDIEQRTDLLRCYTSRVENGHTVPSIKTLEKYARALEVPLYKLFYDGKGPITEPSLPAVDNDGALWGAEGKAHGELRLFAEALSRMNARNRKMLFAVAQQMASHSGRASSK
jgi:transcriptional regulator with XRE-family HTH domain